jgi:hypothetical protein
LLGRWTARLPPLRLAAIAPVWALLTSALEWFVLVPLFPFYQPIFTLQQPYWIGFLVHFCSSLMYPLFPWLLRSLDAGEQRFVRGWSAAVAGLLALSAVGAIGSSQGLIVSWRGADLATDQTFIRHMHTHHAQGIELALLATDRASVRICGHSPG